MRSSHVRIPGAVMYMYVCMYVCPCTSLSNLYVRRRPFPKTCSMQNCGSASVVLRVCSSSTTSIYSVPGLALAPMPYIST